MSESVNTAVVSEDVILSKIHYIRNQKVLLDRDLADIYGVKAIRLREQVKRNIIRFPESFMFQLTNEEVDSMVSQFAIQSKQILGGSRPYVFTEHGVLMLANVLKSEKAIQVSIMIIEIFVKLREMLSTHKDVLLKIDEIEKKLSNNDVNIEMIFEYLKQLLTEPNERNVIEGFVRR